ncbi:MAG: hypothetical protein OXC47_02615 [Cyanobacteria bacterium MAG APA_bin_95]|nr:hypothetical protein [Cyanobacteria bacterium MAG APA_bin_95]
MAVSSPGTTRRQHRLHGHSRQVPHLTRLIVESAACQQRLRVSLQYGSCLQVRRNRQRRRVFRRFARPQPWSWWAGERFWWGLRWFGGGMAVAFLASR